MLSEKGVHVAGPVNLCREPTYFRAAPRLAGVVLSWAIGRAVEARGRRRTDRFHNARRRVRPVENKKEDRDFSQFGHGYHPAAAAVALVMDALLACRAALWIRLNFFELS